MDGGSSRHALQKQELVRTQPERRQDLGIQFGKSFGTAGGQDVIQQELLA
jgi:hypothetical protein